MSRAMNLRRLKAKPAMERAMRRIRERREVRTYDLVYGYRYTTALDALPLGPPYGAFGSPEQKAWQMEINAQQSRFFEARAMAKAKPRRPWWRFWR